MRLRIGGTTSCCCCCGSFGKKCAVPQRPMIEAMRMRIQQSSSAFKSRKGAQKGGCATKSSLSATRLDHYCCQHPLACSVWWSVLVLLSAAATRVIFLHFCAFVRILSDVTRLTTPLPSRAHRRAPEDTGPSSLCVLSVRYRPYLLLLCCSFILVHLDVKPFQLLRTSKRRTASSSALSISRNTNEIRSLSSTWWPGFATTHQWVFATLTVLILTLLPSLSLGQTDVEYLPPFWPFPQFRYAVWGSLSDDQRAIAGTLGYNNANSWNKFSINPAIEALSYESMSDMFKKPRSATWDTSQDSTKTVCTMMMMTTSRSGTVTSTTMVRFCSDFIFTVQETWDEDTLHKCQRTNELL